MLVLRTWIFKILFVPVTVLWTMLKGASLYCRFRIGIRLAEA